MSVLYIKEQGAVIQKRSERILVTHSNKTLAEIPTKFAIMVGQANARWYTIPSEAAFDYGGYEADTSYFARGAGERMGELMNEMLLMTIPN